MADARDAQRAAYVGLLMDLASKADADRMLGLCDRIERAIDSRITPVRRRSWPLLRRGLL